ncbi:polysaccharide deacetylase family protein [Paenisporosarcina sp. OV554]|uniref:polysaccharide deacetylase family protein n=1 Tax=Paenisporosarcina sp. OV554 TaxID=2135694 RepID=UPI000D36FB6C|nr:polysaccharide deacetylase family protein [Paenisporosarcina sp. OV554]PUB08231.1 polysaccharide deacetylase family sporulation protein PdaB [Paenisporosarcina sp. OV554]
MKGKYVLVLSTIILVSSIFHAGFNVFADKGRRHYEQTGEVVWEIKTEEKIVALTFDDGPHRKYTAEVLDLLANYDAKATFFIIGENAEKYPELVLRVHDEGHEIANHTYTHPLKTTITKLEKELKQTNETIYSITGSYPKLFRPVGGQYTDEMIKLAVDKGYKVVMWSWHQDTEDWKNPGVKKIVNKVLNVTKQGDVILFHDGGGNRKQTVKALEEILPELQKQGYKFVTISELIEYKNNK